MADTTQIQWTDATWNIVTGCTRVSAGCARCYIERTPPFRIAHRRFATIGSTSTTGVQLHPDRLGQPMHWRKPRRVFVCSLADLFHEDVPDEYIARAFEAMRAAPTHTFQVLTKRPERARDWFARCGDDEGLGWITHDATPPAGAFRGTGIVVGDHDRWPLPNVWLGVSIENSRYTWRADVLRQIPAAVRFISAEPLLGSLVADDRPLVVRGPAPQRLPLGHIGRQPLDLTAIDWLIIGGESGPGARPFDIEWARELKELAAIENYHRGSRLEFPPLALFVKQLGARPIRSYDVDGHPCSAPVFGINDRKGGDLREWPADLQVRDFPHTREILLTRENLHAAV